jgi:thioredoxin 1
MRFKENLHYFCRVKTMKQIKQPTMKQIILSILLIGGIGITACTQTGTNDKTAALASNDVQPATATTGKVIQMDKAMFLEKVFNYEANPDKWVYLGDKPCIIDFYADWCGPCKKVAPIMSELAAQYKDDIVIYKIDTDKEKELAGVFQIRSIPSILYCPVEGQPTMTMGALPKAEFEKMVKEILLTKPVTAN